MNSIQKSACTGKQGQAQTLPEMASTAALEPLFCPPDYTFPASLAEACAPYSASSALYSLVTIGDERFNNAQDAANRRIHRFETLGSRFYSEEHLQEARDEYGELVPVMFCYAWCSTAWYGLGLDMWEAHAGDLAQLLEERQEEDARYRGLTVADLLSALIEVGGQDAA